MPTLKVLSWNVQNLGDKKLKNNDILSFIVEVILASQADIIGIMEIVGQNGNTLLNQLVNNLNAHGTSHWDGIISDPSFDMHSEQYIYLWNDSSGEVTPLPEGFRLPGILSETAFAGLGISETDTESLTDLLFKNGYLLQDYWVNSRKIRELSRDGDEINLGKSTSMFDDEVLEEVKEILIGHRNLGLDDQNTRPPYLATFSIGPNELFLPIAILHAPNPNDNWRATAINVLGNADVLTNNTDGLIMGDFNVKDGEITSGQVFNIDNKAVRGSTGTKRFRPAFHEIKYIGYKELLNAPTSLKGKYDAKKHGYLRYLSNNYDRFYLKNPTYPNFTATKNMAQVFDVIDLMIVSGDDLLFFGEEILKTYVSRRIYDLKRKKGKNAKDDLAALQKKYPRINAIEIKTHFDAYLAFKAVSDHMPIMISLNY